MGHLRRHRHFIMTPLYYAISVVLVGWHRLFSTVLDPDGGAAWALSIIGLTLVIRAALIPLFVKQIKSSRNMQLIQPKVKELQKKYGHDRERSPRRRWSSTRRAGTNPFASCLPILLQMPIFLALFRLLDQAAKNGTAHGVLTDGAWPSSSATRSCSASIPISATFLNADGDRRRAGRWPRSWCVAMTGDHVPHPAPADEQEHAGRRAQRPVRPAAEDAALRAAGRLRRRWHRVPDRCALLLDHLEPVDDGPAVLRDPQQPGARHAGRARRRRSATPRRRRARHERRPRSRRPPRPSRSAAERRRGSSRRSSPASSASKSGRSPARERSRRPASRDASSERDRRRPATDVDAPTAHDRRREPTETDRREATRRDRRRRPSVRPRVQRLEHEGDIAADYLEELLDIADLDGDLDMDVEGDRAAVSIVGADLQPAGRAATARCWRRCRS